MTNPNIAELTEKYQRALLQHQEAVDALSTARSRECSAINVVNQTQKALDEALGVLKKAAPRDSEWARKDQKQEAV